MAEQDRLNVELSRVHRDYSSAIDDNTKFTADIAGLEQQLSLANNMLSNTKDQISIAENSRDKAEQDLGQAVHNLDKAVAEAARDKAFYQARITALTSTPVPTSQPDVEAAIKDRSVLTMRIENLKKEVSTRNVELARLCAELALNPDSAVLRSELAEAKAVSARLSSMYEQKVKIFENLNSKDLPY
ncbi:hypothetical protein AX14_011650 [Amanita brunnescens Koide BX004]|nr:hypothetical protein AX14_011650 [Amanita brunnescens Koide BX004]